MKYVLAIFAALLLVSCSVKKRTYRDGYYIDWAFNKKTKAPVKKSETPVDVKETIAVEPIVAVKNNEVAEDIFISKHKNTLLMDTCGDIITFKSGDQVTAKVIEISEEKIKYKRCDNLDGPAFVVSKATVASIKYSNGIEEKIVAPTPQTVSPNNPYSNAQQQKYTGPKKVHPKAIWALVCLLVGFIIGITLIPAYFLAVAALREIKLKPDYYSGRVLAKVVKTVCVVLFYIFIGIVLLIALGV